MSGESSEKKDYFGRKYKEKFPYYPLGIIIPRCKPIGRGGKAVCRPGSRGRMVCSRNPTARTRQCLKSQPDNQQSPAGVVRRPMPSYCRDDEKKKKDTNTGKLCEKVAEIVAQEVPCNRIDQEFLQELQMKCKRYWDFLIENSIYLDENAVFEELTTKLRTWVRENHQALENGDQSIKSDTFADFYSDDFEEEEDDEEEEEYENVTRFPLDESETQ